MQMKKFSLISIWLIGVIFLTSMALAADFEVIQSNLEKGESFIVQKKYAEAEEILKPLLQELETAGQNPQDELMKNIVIPRVNFRLGEIQYNQEKYEGAKSYFEKVINPNLKSFWEVKAIYHLGLCDYNLKKYADARVNFSKLVNEYQSSEEAPEAQYYIGLSYELEDNKEQAKASFEKFLTLFPKHPWAEKVKMKLDE